MSTLDSVVTSELKIRRLGAGDLEACLALAADRDWGREDRKWLLLLQHGEGYGIDDPLGGLAGTVVLTRFADTAVAVSMMLVAARYARQGLGRRLMSHAIAQSGDAVIFLYATEQGRPLYEKLGFETAAVAEARWGRFQPDGLPPRSRLAGPGDLPAMLHLDLEVFGADRAFLVEKLLTFADEVRVVEEGGRITGYAAAWPNMDTTVVGPVVARDAGGARALIADLAGRTDGPMRVELDRDRPEMIDWIAGRGVPQAFSTSFMVHGGRPMPGDRTRLFAPFMVALG
ncbi:GNAT family N-acetyltransferase [Microbispora sp. NPDC049125]|uniref:GNAT family N-acetyltransferase n=1 Tax=Microbispora sp. NPDC049125 TaxID=3154929 RepID=UPI003465B2D7